MPFAPIALRRKKKAVVDPGSYSHFSRFHSEKLYSLLFVVL